VIVEEIRGQWCSVKCLSQAGQASKREPGYISPCRGYIEREREQNPDAAKDHRNGTQYQTHSQTWSMIKSEGHLNEHKVDKKEARYKECYSEKNDAVGMRWVVDSSRQAGLA